MIPDREAMRQVLERIDWNKGLSKRQLIIELQKASIPLDQDAMLAIPVGRRYHNPDELLAALPESLWHHEVEFMSGGLPPDTLIPRGHTETPAARERTRESDMDRPED